MKALRFLAQLALYAPLMALIGYFSTEPRFSVVAPGEALVRVSLIHATERKEACRERSAEELANVVHAHPTLAEATMEAMFGAEGRSIHI